MILLGSAGTFELELMLECARRNGMMDKLPFDNVEDAWGAYQFDNLQEFLDIYYLGCAVLITQQVRTSLADHASSFSAAQSCHAVREGYHPMQIMTCSRITNKFRSAGFPRFDGSIPEAGSS